MEPTPTDLEAYRAFRVSTDIGLALSSLSSLYHLYFSFNFVRRDIIGLDVNAASPVIPMRIAGSMIAAWALGWILLSVEFNFIASTIVWLWHTPAAWLPRVVTSLLYAIECGCLRTRVQVFC